MACLMLTNITSFAADKTFKVWWYERENALDTSWKFALDEFSKRHPDVKVQFEQKAFEQIQETAKMILNSNDCPDVMEANKGNATCGMYAKEGLLAELDQPAAKNGWDKMLGSSIQTTCRYNQDGIMGSGKLYGITTYGEFVMVYYNKDLFAKYNLKVPTTLAEFEKVCDTFVKNKVTPIVVGGADKWPQTHNWYELALYKADRQFITNFQLLKDDINFKGPAFKYGSDKLVSYIKKGYIEKNSNGIKYDDANNSFYQGKYPMIVTGSWLFGTLKLKVKAFQWGCFVMPGKKLNTGSGGNLWIVPKNAKNKELAYEFMNLTLQKEAQTVMAEAGGLPVNADVTKIKDPAIKELNSLFAGLVKNDSLAFYPDWPVPGFMDVLGGGLQNLMSSTMNTNQFLDSLSSAYYDYKNTLK